MTADVSGEYAVRLVVIDGTERYSEPAAGAFTVSECGGHAPVAADIAASPSSPNVGDVVGLSAVVSDRDIAECGLDQLLFYTWSIVEAPAGSGARLNDPASRTPSLTADVSGEYAVRLVVIDGTERYSEPAAGAFTVSECGGHAPVAADIAASPSSPNVGDVVGLSAVVSDRDIAECGLDQLLFYTWSIVEAPAGSGARLNDPASRTPSLTADVSGDYAVRLIVMDETERYSEPAAGAFTVSECGGHAPVAGIRMIAPTEESCGTDSSFEVVEDRPNIHLDAEPCSSDADNLDPCNLDQTLYYEWLLFTAPIDFNKELEPNTTVSNPSLHADKDGTYVIYLWVTDETGRRSDPPAVITLDVHI